MDKYIPEQKLGGNEGGKGFDYRIIQYETIHKIEGKDFESLVDAVNPKQGDRILDGCCGYGEVAKRILERCRPLGFKPEVFLLDESKVQLDRAKVNLPDLNSDHIITGDIRATGFPPATLDTVVVKMGLHELPASEQPKILQEAFRILKSGGRFVTWELALDNANQTTFQDIIRKKDELAGFDQLVANRYFPTHDELRALFKHAGFTNVTDFHPIIYRPSMLERKDELVSKERKEILEQTGQLTENDLKYLETLGQQKAKKLTEYVRQRMSPEMKEAMKFEDLGDDISFEVTKMIMFGEKPNA